MCFLHKNIIYKSLKYSHEPWKHILLMSKVKSWSTMSILTGTADLCSYKSTCQPASFGDPRSKSPSEKSGRSTLCGSLTTWLTSQRKMMKMLGIFMGWQGNTRHTWPRCWSQFMKLSIRQNKRCTSVRVNTDTAAKTQSLKNITDMLVRKRVSNLNLHQGFE